MKEITSAYISVIIPCHNGQLFISETINSVLSQTFQNFEIIIINDGSTDDTANVINKFKDSRIVHLNKINSGVSDSRNKGLQVSKGDYVLFLDSDDILSFDFLEKRILFLSKHPNLGFCSSKVIKIDANGNKIHDKTWRGVASNILQEILSYNSEIITCPSNYLFRKEILTKHELIFCTELSSSADRYFLIELSNYTKGGIITNGGELFYRVHNASMSNKLTINLIKDNLLFQKKILQLKIVPKSLRKEFNFKTNYIFAGSYFRLRKLPESIWFSIIAFYHSPIEFFKQLSK